MQCFINKIIALLVGYSFKYFFTKTTQSTPVWLLSQIFTIFRSTY